MNAPCALLIDDHAMFRAGLRQVIKVAIPDLDIFEAGSLDEALACPSSNVTVVLLDNKLNGLSGIDGIAQIKRKWPLIETLQQVIAGDVSGDTTVVPLAQKHLTPRQSAVLGLPANAPY